MCRIALHVLSSLFPLFLLGAIGLTVFRHFDGRHAADGYLMGDAMVLCQLGLAGVICKVVLCLRRSPAPRAAERDPALELLEALLSMPPQNEGLPARLRAVSNGSRPSASPPATPTLHG